MLFKYHPWFCLTFFGSAMYSWTIKKKHSFFTISWLFPLIGDRLCRLLCQTHHVYLDAVSILQFYISNVHKFEGIVYHLKWEGGTILLWLSAMSQYMSPSTIERISSQTFTKNLIYFYVPISACSKVARVQRVWKLPAFAVDEDSP